MTGFPRVLIADGDAVFADAVAQALVEELDTATVETVADGGRAMEAVERFRPHLVAVDVDLPNMPGLTLCATLLTRPRPPALLVLSTMSEHRLLLAALHVGAQGYLGKDADLDELLEVVRALLRGEASVPSRMLGGLLHDLIQRRRQAGAVHERFARLSRREREVLALLAGGNDHLAIARELVISPQTARTHIQNVLSKLGVHSRLEAVSVAVEHGLVEAS